MDSVPSAPAAGEVARILVIGRDQLIRSGPSCDVDFIPTGRSELPDAPLGYAPTLFSRLEYLWDTLRGRYRYILIRLPEPRSHMARLLERSPLQRLLKRLRPQGTTVALLDLSARMECLPGALEAFAPDDYWKLHPPVDAAEPVRLLPLWVYPPTSGWGATPWNVRDIDLFLPPGPDTPSRRKASQWLERLRKEHLIRIRIAPGDISDLELHEQMGRARLVLTPAGEHFHHYRPYQAMLHGAIPILNEPDPKLQTTLVHGENCFFYEENEERFREVILWAATHPEELEPLARQTRRYALDFHTPTAVAQQLYPRS